MSNKSSSSSSSGGVGFVSLLQILFIGLKLAKVIDWSWWWVLSPTWISFAILLLVLLVIGIIIVLAAIREDRKSRLRRALRK